MINKQLINPKSLELLNNYLINPKLPLLLEIEKGNDLSNILNYIVHSLLNLDLNKIKSYPYLLEINKDIKNSIGIDQITKIKNFLKLKVPLDNKINRIIIIKNSQNLTIPAQNKLLKNLEEFPEKTIFILTCRDLKSILPTIRSRVSHLKILRPSRDQLIKYFRDQDYQEDKIIEALNISNSNILITKKILNKDPNYSEALDLAKQIAGQDSYSRLILLNNLVSNKKRLRLVLLIIKQMSRYGIISENSKNALFWQNVLKRTLKLDIEILSNAQLKILVLDYLINFGR
ncbi:MAG: hypothetical protein M1554_00790 [Patescibacteria group bacterium]|jgi:DNA polymerase III delta prime subunit|nr:hypothetical protein [Patescibacteria group bacterium]